MGAIGGMLGLGGGVGGTGIGGPDAIHIDDPVNQGQIDTSYQGVQDSLKSQQQLMQALQGQNGIQNQSNVYNQFQDIAAGRGPNPAQAMLANATGQNVANQASLMAGQRGAGSNVGLMARQAAGQGAGIQQNAVGQGAALQANQSLNALGAAGNLASGQVSNQMAATGSLSSAQQTEQQNLLNAQAQFNAAKVGAASNVNNANASLASTVMGQQGKLIGGLLQGSGQAMGAGGGMIARMADGGMPDDDFGASKPTSTPSTGPMSRLGKFSQGFSSVSDPKKDPLESGAATFSKGLGNAIGSMFSPSSPAPQTVAGGPMDNSGPLSSPDTMAAAYGGQMDYRSGGPVQAKSEKQKATVKSNSYANDKIPAVLSEKEIVIPRNVVLSNDPVGNSAKFVASVLAKQKHGMRK